MANDDGFDSFTKFGVAIAAAAVVCVVCVGFICLAAVEVSRNLRPAPAAATAK